MKRELKPKTSNHHEYVRAIAETDYVLVTGPPGSGKSFIATGMACQSLEDGKVEKIIVTRPMIQAGYNTIGFLKGSLAEKTLPYMTPILEHLRFFLGAEEVNRLLDQEIIEILPLELARGRNLYKSFVLADEIQNADFEQIKMILTRICKGSKVVLNGDIGQSDLCHGEKSCDFKEVIKLLTDLDGLSIIKLTNQDIMRSGMISKILKRFDHAGVCSL